MDDTLLALAAGAIGSLVTLGTAGAARFLTARAQVRDHDRLVAAFDEDLSRWLVDENVRLKRELKATREGLSARGLFFSGQYGFEIGLAKERALQAYRDQETRARREVASILARETGAHVFWRWW